MTIEDYRGISTDRHLLADPSLPRVPGVLPSLWLSPKDLQDKRVLDVGIGRGLAFIEAQNAGLHYYGVDIAPLYNIEKIRQDPIIGATALANYKHILEIQRLYPDRFFPADATESLPFEDGFFDLVLSCHSMPGYALDVQGATTAVLEMIRVCSGRIAFTTSYPRVELYGKPENEVPIFMDMDKLMHTLGYMFDIQAAVKQPIITKTPCLHLDLTSMDRDLFNQHYKFIIQNAQRLYGDGF